MPFPLAEVRATLTKFASPAEGREAAREIADFARGQGGAHAGWPGVRASAYVALAEVESWGIVPEDVEAELALHERFDIDAASPAVRSRAQAWPAVVDRALATVPASETLSVMTTVRNWKPDAAQQVIAALGAEGLQRARLLSLVLDEADGASFKTLASAGGRSGKVLDDLLDRLPDESLFPGPDAAWERVAHADADIRQFRSTSGGSVGDVMTFRRVDNAGSERGVSAFMTTHEMPIGTVLGLFTTDGSRTVVRDPDASELFADAEEGPSSWLQSGSTMIVAERRGWVDLSQFEQFANFKEDVTERSPAQSISRITAIFVADQLACRLPTADEWAAAVEGMTVDPNRPDNVRDLTWRRYFESIDRDFRQGKINKGTIDQISPVRGIDGKRISEDMRVPVAAGSDDGTLWFRETAPESTDFIDLRGNVAEWVMTNVPETRPNAPLDAQTRRVVGSWIASEKVDLRVIGGSALSDPTKLSHESRSLSDDFRFTTGVADVGFRLVFEEPMSPHRLVRNAIKRGDARSDELLGRDPSAQADDLSPRLFGVELVGPTGEPSRRVYVAIDASKAATPAKRDAVRGEVASFLRRMPATTEAELVLFRNNEVRFVSRARNPATRNIDGVDAAVAKLAEALAEPGQGMPKPQIVLNGLVARRDDPTSGAMPDAVVFVASGKCPPFNGYGSGVTVDLALGLSLPIYGISLDSADDAPVEGLETLTSRTGGVMSRHAVP